jgi:hypothetical protein
MALINWLLKLKMHANTFFLILFFMKIQYEIYMYVCIYIYIYIYIDMQHFKENCVFLQYKNTNQY